MPRKSGAKKGSKNLADPAAAGDAPAADVAVADAAADVQVVAGDAQPAADAAAAQESGPEVSCTDQMSQLIVDLDKLAKITRHLANSMKKVKKAHEKEIKSAEKVAKGKKKKPRDPNAPKRAPSGFNKAAPLSKELSKFLGLDAKAELSRPDVTKRITKYIKDNNLQNDTNKREILPDKKLGKLLSGPTDGTALTFFNLQKYIKHHFPKGTKMAA